jgi:cytochrome bd ubiquinol oxidase subunit II
MISILNPGWSLTIANAASGPQTLKIMTIVAAILIPVILAYTAWSYWIFRKRLEAKPEILTY